MKNSRAKKPNEPVVIPSAIGTSKKKILTKPSTSVTTIAKKSAIEKEPEPVEEFENDVEETVEEVQPVKRGTKKKRKT